MNEPIAECPPVRIMIAEHQAIILHSLSVFINGIHGFEVTGTATDGNELLRNLESSKPDIILLDIRRPGPTSLEVTRLIDEKMPWVKVISMSSNTHPVFIREMLRYGAKGFLSKNCAVDELVEGIRRVYEGKTYFCRICSGMMLRDYTAEPDNGRLDTRKITPREIEIIGFLSEGMTTREISRKLFISTATVERHKSNLLKKMGLKNTAHLIRVAIESGLLIH